MISYDYGLGLTFKNMILIDNHYGTGTFLALKEKSKPVNSVADKEIHLIGNKYYGELDDHVVDCSATN